MQKIIVQKTNKIKNMMGEKTRMHPFIHPYINSWTTTDQTNYHNMNQKKIFKAQM